MATAPLAELHESTANARSHGARTSTTAMPTSTPIQRGMGSAHHAPITAAAATRNVQRSDIRR
jgi:hypothetical protein